MSYTLKIETIENIKDLDAYAARMGMAMVMAKMAQGLPFHLKLSAYDFGSFFRMCASVTLNSNPVQGGDGDGDASW